MLVLFCAVAAAAYGGWWWWQQQPGASAADGKAEGKAKKGGKSAKGSKGGPLVVKATQAIAKPMPVLIEAVGTVEPEHSVQMRAQVSGVLQSVLFKEGDKVKAGQLLFQIDPRTFEAAYRQSQAQLARDVAQLENAKVQQQRLEPLLKREFITRQEYDVAVTSTKSLEATVAADRALMEQARIQVEFSRIHAPISGRTGALAVKSGNLVAAGAGSGGAPLVTINSTDPILVTFSIPERQLEEIRRQQDEKEMRIEILPDRSGPAVAEGKLVFIDNTVTTQTGTVLLKTRVNNKEEILWPGQFVNVRIVLRIEPDAVVLPEAAVQPGQDGSFVYLIDKEDKVHVQPIKISRQIGGEVVIGSGVKAGDQVITEIPQALQPGATVQVAGAEGKAGGERGKGKGKKGKGEKSAEGKSEAKAEGKPEAKAEGRSEAKPEGKAGAKAEGKSEAKGQGKAGG
jgi:RND family efflux transporter MFP subunit